MEIRTDLFLGDSKNELKKIKDNSVDLIITSLPYANQRKGNILDCCLNFISEHYEL